MQREYLAKKLTKIVLIFTMILNMLPVNAAKAKKVRYSPLNFISGTNNSLELFINNKSLNLDLGRTQNIRVRVKVRDLYASNEKTSSFKISLYEIINGERHFLTTQNLTLKKGSKKSRVISIGTGYFNAPTKNIEFDVFDTESNLINTYSTQLTAFNLESQVESSKGISLDSADCDNNIFNDCQLDYLFQKVTFEAKPQRQMSTRVIKGEDGLYKVTLPIPRNRFKALGKKVRRKGKGFDDGLGGAQILSDFGETLAMSRIRLGDNGDNYSQFDYDKFGRRILIGDGNDPLAPKALIIGLDGKVGVGVNPATAWLHVRNGSSAVPSMKIDPGPLTTTAQDGALEFDGSDLKFTIGSSRKTVLFSDSAIGTSQLPADLVYLSDTQTVANKTLNNTVITGDLEIQGNGIAENRVLTAIGGKAVWRDAASGGGGGSSDIFDISSNVISNNGSQADSTQNDFVFGSSQLDNKTGTGDDARFMFDKSKAAFRAGKADANEWNESNIGLNSFATGHNTIASGLGSIAMGETVTASSIGAVGVGLNLEVTGLASAAFGFGSAANDRLVNNIDKSLMIGFNSNSATMFVGPGDIATGDSGNVGIGTISPNAKLHVNGDIIANKFIGDGSMLTGISVATNLNNGTVNNTTINNSSIFNTSINGGNIEGATINGSTLKDNSLDGLLTITDNGSVVGNLVVNGEITANKFIGDGSMLTNLPAPSSLSNGTVNNTTINNSTINNSSVTNNIFNDNTVNGTLVFNANGMLQDAFLKGTTTVDGPMVFTSNGSIESDLIVNGDVIADKFVGDGSMLTGITTSNVVNGSITGSNIEGVTINGSRLQNNTLNGTLTITGSGFIEGLLKVNGSISAANNFIGDGSLLTNVTASNLVNGNITGSAISNTSFDDGIISNSSIFNTDFTGGDIEGATINGSTLKDNILDGLLTITGSGSMEGNLSVNGDITANKFIGDGSMLTGITASNVVNGSIAGSNLEGVTINGSTLKDNTVDGILDFSNNGVISGALINDWSTLLDSWIRDSILINNTVQGILTFDNVSGAGIEGNVDINGQVLSSGVTVDDGSISLGELSLAPNNTTGYGKVYVLGQDLFYKNSNGDTTQLNSAVGGGPADNIFDVTNNVVRNSGSQSDIALDDFVFGSTQLNDIGGDSTDNKRFIFDKSKAAFRAGVADNNEWDESNIGENSFATGHNTIASGLGSIAMGETATASSTGAVAVGLNLEVTGLASAALGFGPSSSNRLTNNIDKSLMIGFNSTAPSLFVGPGDALASSPGFVGVGTTNPSAQLEVNGDIVANKFIGDGSMLNNLPTITNLSNGTVNNATINNSTINNSSVTNNIFNDNTINGTLVFNANGMLQDAFLKGTTTVDGPMVFTSNGMVESDLVVNGDVIADKFVGDGSMLTGITASNVVNGSISGSNLEGVTINGSTLKDNILDGLLTITGSGSIEGDLSVNGDVTASKFIGDGSMLTGITASNVVNGSITGSNLEGVTINGSTLKDNILDGLLTITGSGSIEGDLSVNGDVTASKFIGDGSMLTGITASNVVNGSITGSNLEGVTINGSTLKDNTVDGILDFTNNGVISGALINDWSTLLDSWIRDSILINNTVQGILTFDNLSGAGIEGNVDINGQVLSSGVTVDDGSISLGELGLAPDNTTGYGKVYVLGQDLFYKNSNGDTTQLNSIGGGGPADNIFDVTSNVVRNSGSQSNIALDDFVFGSTQLDDIGGDSTDNKRFMFDKSRAAFRAGVADNNEWDESNIGENSFATGHNTIASGLGSIAMGETVRALSTGAVAVGLNLEVTGLASAALGFGPSSSNRLTNNIDKSLMIGFNSTAPSLFVGPGDALASSPGFVGVGTTNPSAQLEVNGDIVANKFIGDGSMLNNLPTVTNLSNGTVNNATINNSTINNSSVTNNIFNDNTVNGTLVFNANGMLQDAFLKGTTTVDGPMVFTNNGSITSDLTVTGDVTANKFIGDGSMLTGITASNVTNGSITGSYLEGVTINGSTLKDNVLDGELSLTSNAVLLDDVFVTADVYADRFHGDGSQLTNIVATDVEHGTITLVNITNSTFNDNTINGTLTFNANGSLFNALLRGTTTVDGPMVFTDNGSIESDLTVNGELTATKFIGDGSMLTGINASSLANGSTIDQATITNSILNDNTINNNTIDGTLSFTANGMLENAFLKGTTTIDGPTVFTNNGFVSGDINVTGNITTDTIKITSGTPIINPSVLTADAGGNGTWTEISTLVSSSSDIFILDGNAISNNGSSANYDNDFVIGSKTLDNASGSDDDSRMFFDKSLGAFRAGTAEGTQWDESNIGIWSFATGKNTSAQGQGSIAMGENAGASSNATVAVGLNVEAAALASAVLGIGASETNKLVNNIPGSLMVGFNSSNPTLFVGPSATTTGSGNIGIGVVNPGAKLEVDGDIIADKFIGDGSMLSNLPTVTNLSNGTINNATINNSSITNNLINDNTINGTLTFNANGSLLNALLRGTTTVDGPMVFTGNGSIESDLTVNGELTATKFIGDGSMLTGINASSLANGSTIDQATITNSILNDNTINNNTIDGTLSFTANGMLENAFLKGTTTIDGPTVFTNNGFVSGDINVTGNITTNTIKITSGTPIINPSVLTADAGGNGTWTEISSLVSSSSDIFILDGNAISNNGSSSNYDNDFVIGSKTLDNVIIGPDDDSRMFFDKSLGAFRAGTAEGTQWDESNIGEWSFATGKNSSAQGQGSIAMGESVAATANATVAVGLNVEATALASAVLGIGASETNKLVNNIPGSLMIGFNSSNPTLFVGPSATSTGSGNIGIGTTSANEKLTVDGVMSLNDLNSAPSASTNYGKVYVNGKELYYKDSDGNETQLSINGGGSAVQELNDLEDVIASQSVGGNIFIGNGSGLNNTGFLNTALGLESLMNNAANHNVAVGHWSMRNNTTGQMNSALGTNSLSSNTTGENNVAIGYKALETNTIGERNVVIGAEAMPNSLAARDSIAIGYQALYNNQVSHNIAIGREALHDISSGTQNIAIGSFAGDNLGGTAVNNIIIGYNNEAPLANNSYQLDIADTIYGDIRPGNNNIGIGINASHEKLNINGATALAELSSAPGATAGFGKIYVNGADLYYKDSAGNESQLSISGGGSHATNIFDISGTVVSNTGTASDIANDDFVFGSSQLDNDTGSSDDDSRMFFDKSLGAFRAGTAQGTQWDESNIGEWSFATGKNSSAQGQGSIAMGESVAATANATVAVGLNVEATALASAVLGVGANASNKLTNNIPGSLMIGFNSSNPTLFVGPSATTTGSGNIGIGTTTASQKLEVNGGLKVHKTITYNSIHANTPNLGGTTTIDWSQGNKQTITLTGDTSIAFSEPPGIGSFVLLIKQDAIGGRTVTQWSDSPKAIKWPLGIEPTLTTVSNATDAVSCLYDGTDYLCQFGFNFQ